MTPAAQPAADRYAVAKAALSQVPHPVVIIAAAAGGERSCATGTAMYVSHAPAQVAIALHPGSYTARLIDRSGEFSISVLTRSQQDIAERAGRSAPAGQDKFSAFAIPEVRVTDPADMTDVPGVAGSAAVLWCRVVHRVPSGDHVLQVGEVFAWRSDADATSDALLRFRRRYLGTGEWTSGEAPEGYPT